MTEPEEVEYCPNCEAEITEDNELTEDGKYCWECMDWDEDRLLDEYKEGDLP